MVHLTAEQVAMYEAIAKASISKNPGQYIAPLLLGGVFDFMLFGVMLSQLWSYYSTAKHDRRWNKTMVAISSVIATATTFLTVAYMLHIFCFNFGHYLSMVSWEYINWYPLLNVLTTTTVSLLYAERAHGLYGRSIWIPIVLAPFILASLAGGFAVKIVAGSHLTDSTQAHKLLPYLVVWLASEVILGLLLTGLIMRRLIQAKTGWSDTDRVINKLAFLSVEAQLPATLVSIAFMISYGIKANSAVNVFFELFHPKIYVVGMLMVLNSRGGLRRALHPGQSPTVPQRPGLKSVPSDFRITQCPTELEFPLEGQELQVHLDRDGATAMPNLSFESSGGQYLSQWTTSDAETAVGSPMVLSPSFRTIKEMEAGQKEEV